ncbi:MAG: S1 family peptidase [Vicinamibacteria bacterium]|nr:S1 family peptidase [Vicinamibacteria bacterium]
MNPVQRRVFLASGLLVLAIPAPAVLVRHDRDDAAYRALAERLPFAGAFDKAGGGTLVGPRLVLTAAHVAQAVERRGLGFELAGVRHVVAAVERHPEWRDAGPGSPHDLALVRLAEPAAATPAEVCATPSTEGDAVLLAGRGDTGTGLTGPRPSDGAVRAAQNHVLRRDGGFVVLRFDGPPGGAALEGLGAPGDSGGGLFRDAAQPCLLGVSAWGDGDGNGPGRYGALDGYTDLVADAAWLRAAMERLK